MSRVAGKIGTDTGKERTKVVTFYRRLPRFDYLRPRSLGETLELLARGKDGQYVVYAGGTDVVPKLKARRMKAPAVLVDLKGIPDLDYIAYDAKAGLRIGALATIFSVARAPAVQNHYPILSQAANSIASTQVQNRGTIVGNICNAVPSADSAPTLLCLGAKVVCVKKGKERTVDLHEFFKGPGETAVEAGELVKEILVPPMPVGSGGVYFKLSPRSRMDLAVVGVSVVAVGGNGSFGDVRIGLGAVAPTPMRALGAERALKGEKVSEGAILAAARTAAEESRPIDDHRASGEYRRMMVEVLVKRALRDLLLSSGSS
ncbi:MAG: xanthine dehydrogenase family protein subunit M [Desulfobacterales bacterium]|nr:xanthine dehydrogenase family protein subunit M [Desulfobacterales bacterium]